MDPSLIYQARRISRWLQVIAAAVMAGFFVSPSCQTPRPYQASTFGCEQEVRYGDPRRGVDLCLAGYARSGDDEYLSWAAQAYLSLGDFAPAEKLAQRLLGGSLQGYAEGHRILSYLTLRREYGPAARQHAMIAFIAHFFTGDALHQTSDTILLSQAAWQVGDFGAALDYAHDALLRARRQHDPRKEVTAQLVVADALRRIGDTDSAAKALESALEHATHPCDISWAQLKKALLYMEVGQESLANIRLGSAADANRRCNSHDISTAIAINQGWLLRRKDPAGALAKLEEVTMSEGEQVETLLLYGYLAADRGALVDADHYFTRAEGLYPPDADWPWEIARARAELFELRGGPFGVLLAEYHYRRAIALVSSLRSTAQARSAYLVSSHRGPYDGLIALLASTGRWRDALSVLLELDASDMLRATAPEALARDHTPLDLASPGSALSTGPPATVDEVLSAWRDRDLVIVIAPTQHQIELGRERAYRLRIANGQITGEDVGDARAARMWAEKLFIDPTDQSVARALGRMIVPSDIIDKTLDVLAIGPLGKAPLAALRGDDGALSISRRPLARVLALRPSRVMAGDTGPPVVIADPKGDLPSAMREGYIVARALGSRAQLSGSGASAPATRERLWMAREAEVLHIAAHIDGRGRWRALLLADGEVTPAEMVQHRLAPRLAVLASCGSAAAQDEEGWGSIAAALLEAGTPTVIATDRTINDDVALSLMRYFYAQSDWRVDTARALARAQQIMEAQATTSGDAKARVWAAFIVLRRPPLAMVPPAR